MLKCDWNTYVKDFIDQNEYKELMSKKEEIIQKLNESPMSGWTEKIEDSLVEDIKTTASFIKNHYDCLVVVGIGGSYLGCYAFDKIFRKYFNDDKFELIFAGTTLSTQYLDELATYLDSKNFCLFVISKSGTTMETTITYKVLKDIVKRKYPDHMKEHIIIVTDKEKGYLRPEVQEEGYKSYIIPDNIGGRYSFITPAHLLPVAINHDLDEVLKGYYRGKRLLDEAYEYAVIRNLLFKKGKYIENFCVYEENLYFLTEWLKQLFGETEGKNGVGIFPTSSVHTRDLHSLGQFIQEGNKIIFETFLKIESTKDFIHYNGRELHEINNIVEDSVIRAHYSGGVPCIELTLDEVTEETIASLMYFFMLAAAFSGYLFGVEPFDQPGVEVYKKEVKESL